MSRFYWVAFALVFLLAAYVVIFQGGVVKFGSVEIKSNDSISTEKSKASDGRIGIQEQNANVKGSGTAVNASGGASVTIKR